MFLYMHPKIDKHACFLFGIDGLNNPKSIKKKASDTMKSVLKDPNFHIVLDDKKGTHSMRKFAAEQLYRKSQMAKPRSRMSS